MRGHENRCLQSSNRQAQTLSRKVAGIVKEMVVGAGQAATRWTGARVAEFRHETDRLFSLRRSTKVVAYAP